MASNQASMARRARERASQQQRLEKQARRQQRREQKKNAVSAKVDDPMNDPTIDWGDAVREIRLPVVEEEGTGEAVEPEM
jgi:hypothetical protein